MSEKTFKPGWPQMKFGDVVHHSKIHSKDLLDGIERYIGLEHFEPRDLGIYRWGNVAGAVTSTSVLQPGQLLFGKLRAFRQQIDVLVETQNELITEDIERA